VEDPATQRVHGTGKLIASSAVPIQHKGGESVKKLFTNDELVWMRLREAEMNLMPFLLDKPKRKPKVFFVALRDAFVAIHCMKHHCKLRSPNNVKHWAKPVKTKEKK